MKKRTMLLAITVVLVLAFAATSPAKTIKLRYAQQNPDTGWSTVHCVEPWLKKLEAATDGKVQIQAFHGQTLAKGKDMWNAVKTGITDIGWCFHGYWPGMTPLTDVISLPAMPFTSAEQGSAALWRIYEKFPQIQKEFQDVKVLLFYTSEPYSLITRDKPVKLLEDIKGMKIRMTGGPPTDMMKELGGVPMLIPMPDNYISLQKGVIDGMGAPWEAINVWRFYEVVNYYTEVPFPSVYFSIAMNKNKWNSLPKEVQDGIMSVGGLEGSKFWGRNFFDAMKAQTLEKLKAKGQGDNIYKLTSQERQRWVDVGGKPVWSKWVKSMNAKGHKDAQAILDTTLSILSE
jgi:TRAP-type C4-dicarboxylate transport system substrate-binding protein